MLVLSVLLGFFLVICSTFAQEGNYNVTSSCTLSSAISGGSCSTSQVRGLTDQIIAQMNKMGYTFTELDSTWIHCTDSCVNQLQASAATALKNAAIKKNDYITLNSATRSSAQQYLLYEWYIKGKCSIGLAAVPGTSNHEGGRAIDTSSYSYWLSTLQSYGWTHSYPDSDPVHFDYYGATDLAKQNLKAFQMIYNIHTGKGIAEDGIYGTNTANALAASPCNGW